MIRYVYSRHSSLDKAVIALEYYYANGDISPCEFDRIGKDSLGNVTIELKGN